MNQATLFPPENPVWCNEKNEKPFYEMKCCAYDNCNLNLTLSFPVQGTAVFFVCIIKSIQPPRSLAHLHA